MYNKMYAFNENVEYFYCKKPMFLNFQKKYSHQNPYSQYVGAAEKK